MAENHLYTRGVYGDPTWNPSLVYTATSPFPPLSSYPTPSESLLATPILSSLYCLRLSHVSPCAGKCGKGVEVLLSIGQSI